MQHHRQLTELNIGSNRIISHEDAVAKAAGRALSEGLEHSNLEHLDLSKNVRLMGHCEGKGAVFAQQLAIGVSASKNLVSINVLGNAIGHQQAKGLIAAKNYAKKDSGRRLSLCGFSGTEKELDLSGEQLSQGCVLLVADDIKTNSALTSLNVSNSVLCTFDHGIYDASGRRQLEML